MSWFRNDGPPIRGEADLHDRLKAVIQKGKHGKEIGGAMLGAAIIVATRDLLAPNVLAGHAATLLGFLFLTAAAGRAAARHRDRRTARRATGAPAGRRR